MGANCCVAGREKPLPSMVNHEVSTYRNFRHSPSWSLRWDNRTHIEDIMENHAQFSHHNSGNASSEVKSPIDTEIDVLSDGDSPFKWGLSTRSEESENKCIAADQSTGRNSTPEVKCSLKSSVLPDMFIINASVAIPSLSSSTIKIADPSSSSNSIIPSDPTSKKVHRSPGYQLCGQDSDSRIPSLKSLNECNSPVGRNSFVLSNELSTGGSHGGGSDGWSMKRTFSELVASSQRERWSFDSENFSSFTNNIFGSTVLPKTHHSPDTQNCGICSKLLKEKSPWSRNIVTRNDLSVVAVLVCSHVYHAECLESSTPEIERYDPHCPICENNGERPTTLEQLGKSEQKGRNKISKIANAYDDVDEGTISNRSKRNGKGAVMGFSSSIKSSISSPFLKRHFSTGSRPVRSALENETRKKGFWERYRRG